jgi:carboxyl-terminal processing protease
LGKGSVQQSYTLSDGSELRVTIARWYTPDNITIGMEGIAPDIEVETPADLGGDEDGQLQRAIDFLLDLE